MKYGMILLVYVDDCIILAESEVQIDVLIHSLIFFGTEKYIWTEEGSIDKFLGISIFKLNDNQYYLGEPLLIERIIEFIAGECSTELNSKQSITTVGKTLLHIYFIGVTKKYGWNYQTAVGVIGYIQQNTRPDISMNNPKCAHFVSKPMCIHEQAIIRIDRYLQSTSKGPSIFSPTQNLDLNVSWMQISQVVGHKPTRTTYTILCLVLDTSLCIPVVLLDGAES